MNRIERIKESIRARKARGLQVGRPREYDHHEIRRLRSSGLLVRKIADVIGSSTWPVQYALKGEE